jgi:hypothetical protein
LPRKINNINNTKPTNKSVHTILAAVARQGTGFGKTSRILSPQTHQGLKSGHYAHGHSRNDLLDGAHLPEQAQQPEGPQYPQLLHPRIPAIANEEKGHRHGHNHCVEYGPAVCLPRRRTSEQWHEKRADSMEMTELGCSAVSELQFVS